MTIGIRKATEADLLGRLNLYSQPEIDDGLKFSMAHAKALFERIHHYPNHYLYTIELSISVIGTFALLIMDNLLPLGHPFCCGSYRLILQPLHQE